MWTRQSRVGVQKPTTPYSARNVNWIKYREAAERKMRESVPDRIRYLLREYWSFDPMPFHTNFLQEMFAGGKIVRCWPTDHAKSMMSSFFFPLLSLMNDPDEAHLILGANQNDSQRRLSAIQMEIDTNKKLIEDWPWLAKPKTKDNRLWSRKALTIVGRTSNKPNPSVYASAVGAADIRGRRGKLVMDDIEGIKHRNSVVERDKLYDFVKFEAIRNYEDIHESSRPLLCLVGTPFDPRSIYLRLREEGWNVELIPYRYPEDHPDPKRRGRLIWPAKMEKIQELRKLWRNPLQWAIAMEMNPKGNNPNMLSYEEITDMARGGLAATDGASVDATLVSLDPASGSEHRRADYAGMTQFRITWAKDDDLPIMELHAAERSKDELWEQVSWCKERAERANLPVIVEGNSQQWGSYSSVFRNIAPGVRIIRHQTAQQNKTDPKLGITVIKTMLRQGRLHIPESMLEEEGVQALIREISDLGMQGSHDHLCASLWFGVWWAYKERRVNRGPQIVSGFVPAGNAAYRGYRPRIAAYRNF